MCQGPKPKQFYPNADLVACSYVGIGQNSDGTLNIDFSWDRKVNNYEKIDGPIAQYLVRHGPLVNGKPTNDTTIFSSPADRDAVTLKNVVIPSFENPAPEFDYFIQICAVGNGPVQGDIWDHAWLGGLGLAMFK